MIQTSTFNIFYQEKLVHFRSRLGPAIFGRSQSREEDVGAGNDGTRNTDIKPALLPKIRSEYCCGSGPDFWEDRSHENGSANTGEWVSAVFSSVAEPPCFGGSGSNVLLAAPGCGAVKEVAKLFVILNRLRLRLCNTCL